MKQPPNRALTFGILLALLLALCACQTKKSPEPIIWHNTLTDYFSFTSEQMQTLGDGILSPNLLSENDELRIEIQQVLSDENSLYLAMQVQFQADFPLEELLAQDSASDIVFLPSQLYLLSGKVDAAQLAGKSPDEIKAAHKSYMRTYSARADLCSFDQTTRTASYLLSFLGGKNNPESTELSLVLGDFTSSKDGGQAPVSTGLHSFTWTDKKSAQVTHFDLSSSTVMQQAHASVTPLGIVLNYGYVPSATIPALLDETVLLLADGSNALPSLREFNFSGGDSSGVLRFAFKNPLDLRAINVLQIGDERFAPS